MNKVAVVVAAYNADSTLRPAVESILKGTLKCTVYVVDDCSDIPVKQTLARFRKDLEIVRLERNQGPAIARNVALQSVLAGDFKYVAVMDADDIAYPNRLAVQVAYMESNPHVGACGTFMREFHCSTRLTVGYRTHPTDHHDIEREMFFNSAIQNASTMFRCDALREVGLYSEKYPTAEDYDLLRRVGKRYFLGNIPDFLVHYRISPNGQSQGRRTRQLYDRLRVQISHFEPSRWEAWAGVVQTLIILAMPRSVFQRVKQALKTDPPGDVVKDVST